MAREESSICVYTMTHGPPCDILPEYCTPLELGAAVRTDFLYDLRDNMRDEHISQKDKLYCELTGLYWLWKNDAHEITGLTHYRRIFPIEKNHVEKILETHDIILPLFIHLEQNCERQYIANHIKEDWEIMSDTLKEMYPEYYVSAKRVFSKKRLIPCNMFIAKRVFSKKRLIPCNMFIAKRDVVDRYCSWLFPLLFAIESKLDLNNRSNYQGRVIGFLAERLFTLWINHNYMKIKHIPMLFVMEGDSEDFNDTKNIYTINYLLSATNCISYSTRKIDNRCVKNKHLSISPHDKTMKKSCSEVV